LSPRAGHVSAPVRQGPALASHRSVKAEGIERGFERRRVPSTGCQQPGDNPAHGHVGSSSTEGTSGAADLAPLRGGTGEAALGRFGASWACGWDRRRRRALQPALPRSHDRRCPSGSGWGEAPAARTLRGALHGRRRPPRADGPWPVKARLVSPGSPDGPSDLLAGREAREACARESERAGPARVRFRRHAPRAGPRGSRLEEPPWRRHLEGTTEGNLQRTGRGSGDSAVVLAGCSGCRSRRAAPGPRLRAWV
jgi:hypothetical protein